MHKNKNTNSSSTYIGNELDLFEKAINWKKYFCKKINPYLSKSILEVGAGTGSTTKELYNHSANQKWTCLEPDITLSEKIKVLINKNSKYSNCRIINGLLQDIPKKELFEAILYIDVLEHIDNDVSELNTAIQHLSHKGYLIILVPAHQFLYSQFDSAIGHCRRYNKSRLRKIIPSCLTENELLYLDSAGFLASLANKALLKQKLPTSNQIKFWDNHLIRISKKLDSILCHTLGKSILGIWQKTN